MEDFCELGLGFRSFCFGSALPDLPEVLYSLDGFHHRLGTDDHEVSLGLKVSKSL